MDPRLKPAYFIHSDANDMNGELEAVYKSMLDAIDGVEDMGENGDNLDAIFFGGGPRGLYRALSTATKERLERRDASGKCTIPSSYMFLSLCLSSDAK